MGRLTDRDKHGRGIWVEDSSCSYHFFDKNGDMYSVMNKLAHYEDLEEQGRLIEIIRCKDCRHEQYCRQAQYLGADGYCSKAELKELEGEKE